jgi:hypothetical protein
VTNTFFALEFDPSIDDFTYFGEPKDASGISIDWWEFSGKGIWRRSDPLSIDSNHRGAMYDFNFGAGEIPYVTSKVTNLFMQSKELRNTVQFIPVQYGLQTVYLMNIIPLVACVDVEKTKSIMRWEVQDDEPDKVGKYRQIIGLRVRPEALKGVEICRVKDWDVAIIVSAKLKEMLEENDVDGVVFEPV